MRDVVGDDVRDDFFVVVLASDVFFAIVGRFLALVFFRFDGALFLGNVL